jgi:PPOX class probable F420-dependent enzyme
MPYRKMTEDEAARFLVALPARTGVLATVRGDGRPHAAPVWFDVEDRGDIIFNTGATTVKGLNLSREGRAAICVQDPDPPYAFVSVEGSVTLIDDLAEVRASATRIGGRYMGEDRADEFGRRNGVAGELLVRLHPEKVTAAVDLAE